MLKSAPLVRLLTRLLYLLGSSGCLGLRINSIQVPAAVMNSSSQVGLVCDYDLQADQLYSVKWYKNYVEFYRYQPLLSTDGSSAQSRQEFELDGIDLNLSKCNSTHVYLRNVLLATEGTYKCEVSVESPSFATVSMERRMKVYALPRQKPTIVDNSKPTSSVYTINDTINLTCVQTSSRPSAKLSWLLNDSPVPADSSQISESSSEQSIRSNLTFSLQPQHLLSSLEPNTRLKFRCLAKLEFEYTSETQVSIAGGRASGLRLSTGGPIELPAALPLLDHMNDDSTDRAETINLDDPLIYRWPPVVSRPRNNHTHQNRVDTSMENHIDPDRRAPSPANVGRVQIGRMDIRAQSDHIDRILRLTRPNQLEPPKIEARSLWRSFGDPNDTKGSTGEAQHGGQYDIDELVEFVCKARVDQRTLARVPISRTRWFLNNQEIPETNGSHKVSLFDGHKFRLVALPAVMDVERYRPVQRKSAVMDNGNAGGKLLVEFTSSLFQLKELNLKCQTQLEQTLIEYSSDYFVVQMRNGAVIGDLPGTGSQFIQVADKPALNRTKGRHYFTTSLRHNSAPARAKQVPSSSSSSSLLALFVFGENMIALLVCLIVACRFVLASR